MARTKTTAKTGAKRATDAAGTVQEGATDIVAEAPAGSTGPVETIRGSAAKAARQAGDKARELVNEGTTRAAGALDDVSRMVMDAADTVDEKVGANYGRYARSAADALSTFSTTLKDKNADDLIEDARGFVRKSPAVAIGIAAALGFVIARVMKAGFNAADNDADA